MNANKVKSFLQLSHLFNNFNNNNGIKLITKNLIKCAYNNYPQILINASKFLHTSCLKQEKIYQQQYSYRQTGNYVTKTRTCNLCEGLLKTNILDKQEKYNYSTLGDSGGIHPLAGTTQTTLLTEKSAIEMIYKFSDTERGVLLKALNHYDSQKAKTQFEGKLAATRWRSRFGRPAKVPHSLGDVDPTGSYCAVPEDWLQKKFVEASPPPTTNDLIQLMFVNSLPFIGFGFLDNFTMIIAGEYIEHTLGLYMCISTMAAAALGNTISDVIGIGSAFYVERAVEAVGVKPPKLTPVQLSMKISRRSANFGRVLGITIGCILGMCPLMFMKEKEKKEILNVIENNDSPDNIDSNLEKDKLI